VVWARRQVASDECPKSYITGDSMAWLELFNAWKRVGFPRPEEMNARDAHAVLILEQEMQEARRGEQ